MRSDQGVGWVRATVAGCGGLIGSPRVRPDLVGRCVRGCVGEQGRDHLLGRQTIEPTVEQTGEQVGPDLRDRAGMPGALIRTRQRHRSPGSPGVSAPDEPPWDDGEDDHDEGTVEQDLAGSGVDGAGDEAGDGDRSVVSEPGKV